jgi:hypothetical protein
MTRSFIRPVRLFVVLCVVVVGALAFTSIGRASALALADEHLAQTPGSEQPATQQFPTGTTAVYFDYLVQTPSSSDTASVAVYTQSGSQVVSSVLGTPGVNLPIYATLQGTYPDGQYCAAVVIDDTVTQTIPFAVGNASPAATCSIPAADTTVTATGVPTSTVTGTPATPLPTSTGTITPTVTGTITATATGTLTAVPTSTPLATSTPGIAPPPPPPPPGGATNTPVPTNTAIPTPTPIPPTATPVPTPGPKHFVVKLKGKPAVGKTVNFGVHVQGTHGKALSSVTVKVFAKSVGINKTLTGHTGKHGTATFHKVHATKAGTVVIKAMKTDWATVTTRLKLKK